MKNTAWKDGVELLRKEKSCGALVYRTKNGEVELLLLKHRFGGHWSFPKGHVEEGETEVETALREVHEETGLTIQLEEGFRQSVEYYPRPNIRKQVVYFLGYADDDRTKRQEEEISEIRWVLLKNAHREVTFRNDKNLINHAKKFLRRKFSRRTEPETRSGLKRDPQSMGEKNL